MSNVLDFQHVVIPFGAVDRVVEHVVEDGRRHVGEDGIELEKIKNQ